MVIIKAQNFRNSDQSVVGVDYDTLKFHIFQLFKL